MTHPSEQPTPHPNGASFPKSPLANSASPVSPSASSSRFRTGFHRELERLQDEVLVLGSMVEKATLRAVDALRSRNLAAARAIEAEDTLVNRKRFEIEE